MSEELKGCPFCGGKAEIKHIGNEHTKKRKVSVLCSTNGCSCRITVGAIQFDMEWCEEKAIEKWENRSTDNNIKEALEVICSGLKTEESFIREDEDSKTYRIFSWNRLTWLKSILKGSVKDE